ncbi:MAG TPA: biotin/lipoyl-binding protein [Mycobacteriales bacterium]|nr:biotin/lipoyl-binding protein [Mycobacteriales bacterium]
MHSRARWVAGGVAVVVLAGGGTALGLAGGPGHSYRTATAATGSVTQTVAATGVISPVSAADEAFQVSGSVARVAVKTGQHVRAGQLLARLDRSSLRDELHAANAALAAARSRLSADEAGQSAAASSRPGTLQSDDSAVVSPAPSSAPAKGGGLAQQQAEVRAAQQVADRDLTVARQSLTATQRACEASAPPAPSATPSDTPTDSPTPLPSTPSEQASDQSTCTTASAALLAAQQQVSRDQSRLASAEDALSRALAAAAAAASTAKSPTSHNGSTSGAGGASSAPASAAQLALDQASIDQAVSQAAVAKADLAQATLRSTLAGRIADVAIARGDRVTSGSSSDTIRVVGSQQEQATLSLSATQIRRVKVGLPARVLPDGSTDTMTGRVVAINAAGSTSENGAVSYPVTVSLPSGTHLVAGAAASVTLVVSRVAGVLTVPTSAVRRSGSRSYVEVVSGARAVQRSISVGVVGAVLTQVRSGLVAGQVVVLADLDAAVPSSNLSGGGGFFGGGGRRFARQFVSTGGGGPTVKIGSAPG